MNSSQENISSGMGENIKLRGCSEPISDPLSPDQRRVEDVAELQPPSQPIVTIDDLENLAEKLLAEIRIFKSYKYPLDVRRGVKPF
jgi:hypothetical protein